MRNGDADGNERGCDYISALAYVQRCYVQLCYVASPADGPASTRRLVIGGGFDDKTWKVYAWACGAAARGSVFGNR